MAGLGLEGDNGANQFSPDPRSSRLPIVPDLEARSLAFQRFIGDMHSETDIELYPYRFDPGNLTQVSGVNHDGVITDIWRTFYSPVPNSDSFTVAAETWICDYNEGENARIERITKYGESPEQDIELVFFRGNGDFWINFSVGDAPVCVMYGFPDGSIKSVSGFFIDVRDASAQYGRKIPAATGPIAPTVDLLSRVNLDYDPETGLLKLDNWRARKTVSLPTQVDIQAITERLSNPALLAHPYQAPASADFPWLSANLSRLFGIQEELPPDVSKAA